MRPRRAALLLGAAALLTTAPWALPPAWNPWAPLDLRAALGPLTALKLRRLDPAACRAAFAAADLPLQALPDRPGAPDCTVTAPVRLDLPDTAALRPPGPTASCRLAATWTVFERHIVQPAAREAFGQEVRVVRHLGTQACRDIATTPGRRSRHAVADAIDLAAFVLADGREVAVARDWSAAGPLGAFLRRLRDGACRLFDVTLGPEYDATHRDHLHLDLGGGRACR